MIVPVVGRTVLYRLSKADRIALARLGLAVADSVCPGVVTRATGDEHNTIDLRLSTNTIPNPVEHRPGVRFDGRSLNETPDEGTWFWLDLPEIVGAS